MIEENEELKEISGEERLKNFMDLVQNQKNEHKTHAHERDIFTNFMPQKHHEQNPSSSQTFFELKIPHIPIWFMRKSHFERLEGRCFAHRI